jgi:hypothetical protein
MNGFGEALAGLMSGMMIIIGILAVISIFGIWKLFELGYWIFTHTHFNWS